MLTFTSYRCGGHIYIDKKYHYLTGEILCAYLNADFGLIDEKRALLSDYSEKLMYPQSEDKLGQYSVTLRIVNKLVSSLWDIMIGLPPFCDMTASADPELISYVHDIATGAMPGAASLGQGAGPFLTAETVAGRHAIADINSFMKTVHKKYLGFCDDILRIKYIFRDFMDNYYMPDGNASNAVPSVEVSKAFLDKHRESAGKPSYLYLTPIYRPYNDYEIIEVKGENGESKAVLSEVIRFYDIGSFLANEFFSGLQSGSLPKRCTCCKRYFLPFGGSNSEFCGNVAPGEATKTCRDVGARKKYDEKVKNNPIWRIYQRSYKTHYARYMKNKISAVEFDVWSKFASELRDRMLSGEHLPEQEWEMCLSDYEAAIRK